MKKFTEKTDEFYKCHPIVNFTFFIAVVVLTMFFLHPVFLIISLMSAVVYLIMYREELHLPYLILMLLFIIVFNVLINHRGETILFYLYSGNPVTLESFLYGISAGFMIIAVILWFYCYMKIIDSDKTIYLLGKLSKKLSLVFSMTLRFIPLLVKRLKEVYNIQKLLAPDNKKKLKIFLNSFYITFSQTAENAIILSNSMKSRGYELKGRSFYNNYKFSLMDKVIWLLIVVLFLITVCLLSYEGFYIRYFPSIKITTNLFGIIAAGILCFLPILINVYYLIMQKIGGKNGDL